jgi:hypothetical protein
VISEKVQKELDSARKFGEQLEQLVVSKNLSSGLPPSADTAL